MKVFSWTDSDIALFTLWGCLDFPLFFLPSAWMLGRSLRLSVLAAAVVMVLGAGIRCLPLVFAMDDQVFLVLCNVGAVLNAMGGPIAMSAPIQV